jgi:8-oxo-dGTP diphosphatase
MKTGLPTLITAAVQDAGGEIIAVVDRSWPRDNSAVWEVTTATCRRLFVKRHPTVRFHEREVNAYRNVVPVLGRGRAPELIAADRNLLAVVLTALPGVLVKGSSLSLDEELEVYQQAGQLLRRIHDAPVAADGMDGIERLVVRHEEHLRRTDGLLNAREIALVRESADALMAIRSGLRMAPTHGDFQPRNFLWDQTTRRLGLIDFERAEDGPVLRDLVRLEIGPWAERADLRDSFFAGYGRDLTDEERTALRYLGVLDALSGLQWGTAHGDIEVTRRSRDTFARLT